MKFRKKPVVIEAIQFDGNNDDAVMEFAERKAGLKGDELMIFTLEGVMRVDKNDWVIKGVKGEFYPCKPDIFETTYERVDS